MNPVQLGSPLRNLLALKRRAKQAIPQTMAQLRNSHPRGIRPNGSLRMFCASTCTSARGYDTQDRTAARNDRRLAAPSKDLLLKGPLSRPEAVLPDEGAKARANIVAAL